MINILLVEANEEQSHRIETSLCGSGYTVFSVLNMEEALSVLDKTGIQLIVANSDCDGINLTTELREVGNTIPVIVTTANTARAEMRRIFRSRADGYMTFPLDLEELSMRIENLLWRCDVLTESTLRFGSNILHSQTLTLETVNGEIELRRMEFLLLEKLISYPGKIFTRPQLMDELWGYESESDPRTVDTHIRRLRKKLRDVEDIRIQTVRGLGYRAVVPRKIRKAAKNN